MTLALATGSLRAVTGRLPGLRSVLSAPSVAFPTDANIVDVTKAPYSADPTGVTASSATIRQACLDHDRDDVTASPHPPVAPLAPWTIFLPAGTYKANSSIDITGSTLRIVGAGRDRVTIKLADNCAGFTSAASPLPVLKTGSAQSGRNANAGFANYVEHLTVDVGSGNLGADGIRFDVANVGTMRHVLIKSSDATKRGRHGLNFATSPGSGLVADVTIEGFDVGIYHDTDTASNNIVYCDVTLTDQRTAAVVNTQGNAAFENLIVSGAPVAIQCSTSSATIIVVGGELHGPGSGTAITAPAGTYVYLRDVKASGWDNLVTIGGVEHFVGATEIAEWASYNYFIGKTSTAWSETGGHVSLNLPIRKAPQWYPTDVANWVNVASYATPQAAIDAAATAGKTVVYFPYALYTLTADLIVHGSVRKVDFMGSAIQKSSSQRIIVQSQDPGVGTVYLENLCSRCEINHNSAADVVVRHWSNLSGLPTLTTGASATGDLFLEDSGPHTGVIASRPVNVWVRQLNRERQGVMTVSGGATVWEFGDNIEDGLSDPQAGQSTATGATSRFELIGGVWEALGGQEWPAGGIGTHQFTDATVSVLMPGTYGSTGYVGQWLKDTQGGVLVGDLEGGPGNANSTEYVIGASVGGRQRVMGIPVYVTPA